jgi:hypothetical protein
MLKVGSLLSETARPRRSAWSSIACGAVAVGILGTVGCGQSAPPRATVYPVQGKIELNGKPTAGAVVILHPKEGSAAPPARAEVKPDGTFAAGTYGATDGAAEGDYVVTVEWFKPVLKNDDYVMGPNLIPKKYSERQTSQIEVHVAAQTNELPTIKLKR